MDRLSFKEETVVQGQVVIQGGRGLLLRIGPHSGQVAVCNMKWPEISLEVRRMDSSRSEPDLGDAVRGTARMFK